MTQANDTAGQAVLKVGEGTTRDNSSLGVAVYYEIMKRTVKEGTPRHRRIRKEAKAFLEQVAPRDPLEQVLAEQILWMHGTMAYLSHFAAVQSHRGPWVKLFHGARDRLSNACRKHVMALAEYRRPRRSSSFTAVRQANIAQQQIVTSAAGPADASIAGEGARGRLESGESHGGFERVIACQEQAALPLERAGEAEEARAYPADSAVEMEYGAADAAGQAAGEPESPDPRDVQP